MRGQQGGIKRSSPTYHPPKKLRQLLGRQQRFYGRTSGGQLSGLHVPGPHKKGWQTVLGAALLLRAEKTTAPMALRLSAARISQRRERSVDGSWSKLSLVGGVDVGNGDWLMVVNYVSKFLGQ